jgi:hypothetical protein
MQPYCQLTFSTDQIPDVIALLAKQGYSVIIEEESWLNPKYPEFRDIVIEKNQKRTVLAWCQNPDDPKVNELVYVNSQSDQLMPFIEKLFTDHGAISSCSDYT